MCLNENCFFRSYILETLAEKKVVSLFADSLPIGVGKTLHFFVNAMEILDAKTTPELVSKFQQVRLAFNEQTENNVTMQAFSRWVYLCCKIPQGCRKFQTRWTTSDGKGLLGLRMPMLF